MQQVPGSLGKNGTKAVVDKGTMARTRHHAPAHRHRKPKPRFDPHRPLTADEQSVLAGLDAAKIADLNERAMFLAQTSHESQDFTRMHENLNYKAPRLLAMFPLHFDDLADAEEAVKGGPAAIAESIYGGRADLGNATDGDGARYFGRGYMQLTGKDGYTEAGEDLNLDLVNHPELAEAKTNALRIAIWCWNKHKVGPPARKGDVTAATRIINGKLLNGLSDRIVRYDRYHRILTLRAANATTSLSSAVPADSSAPALRPAP